MRKKHSAKPRMKERRAWNLCGLIGGGLLLTLAWLVMMRLTGHEILKHSPYDSYTLMAMAWRKGLLHLEQDYPWLELAIFKGEYYVSFPPVPTVVMWLLSFAFGVNTPSNLVVFAYLLLSYGFAYALARRFCGVVSACMRALFLCVGCNLFACTMDGGVWYQAQLLAFLLLIVCAYGLTDRRPALWGVGLFALALSVGCRPFDAVFVPFALWLLWDHLRTDKRRGVFQTLMGMLPYCVAPACVAFSLAGYNYARFGNVLEFGHNYLPEFTRDPDLPQMGLQYIGENLSNILRLPRVDNGNVVFERFNGFAFWLANPMFVSGAVFAVLKIVRRKWDGKDTLLCVMLLGETILLLAHKTFGGWQFGTRYLCDLLPMVFFFSLRGSREKSYVWEWILAAFAIGLNLYGTFWLYCL